MKRKREELCFTRGKWFYLGDIPYNPNPTVENFPISSLSSMVF
jgi:hypothetical protein